MTPPSKILIVTDSNELAYTQTIKSKTGDMHEYVYTKVGLLSDKLGCKVCFTEKDLLKYLSYSFKEI